MKNSNLKIVEQQTEAEKAEYNPLLQLDSALKNNVLDLWERVHDLIDQSGESGMFNFWQLVPDHEKAGWEEIAIFDELKKKHQVHNQLIPLQQRQEEAITRLYLAIGFVIGLRLSGATEEKINFLDEYLLVRLNEGVRHG